MSSKPVNGEKIIESVDDHWIVLVKPLAFYVLGWGVVGVLMVLAQAINQESVRVVLFLISLLTITALNHILMGFFLYWKASSLVITNRRLVDFQFLPYVRHDLRSIKINEIDEIEKIKRGLWRNIFNYGDLKINLAAMPKPIEIKNIPVPSRVAGVIHGVENPSLAQK